MKIRVVRMMNGDFMVMSDTGFPAGAFIPAQCTPNRFNKFEEAEKAAREYKQRIDEYWDRNTVDKTLWEIHAKGQGGEPKNGRA